MKLYHLHRRKDAFERDGGRWTYDCTYGFVVRAPSEDEARRIAMGQSTDEVTWHSLPVGQEAPSDAAFMDHALHRWTSDPTWMRADLTTCEELVPEGEVGVVMSDYLSG